MRPFVHFVLATGIATGAVAAQEFYIPKNGSLTTKVEHGDEPFPAPVTGTALFSEEDGKADAPKCLPAAQILGIFAMDVEAVGGEILTLTGGLEQDFADQWRATVGVNPVDVSQIFAHVVPAEDGDAIVDVVEIDADGCALSRTLLSKSDWLSLLVAVKGVEV